MVGTVSTRSALRLGLGMGGSLLAMTIAGQALAQTGCTTVTAEGVCVIENSAARGALAIASPVRVINTGSITGAPAISAAPFVIPINEPTVLTAIIENRAGGTITGTGGVAVAVGGTLINAGTITGNVIGVPQYVANGGTLNGNLTLGSGQPNDFASQIFVQRGLDTGVTGTVNAGLGIDFFVRSFDASTPLVLTNNPLPASFEVRGVEARGSDTTITLLSAPGVTIGGLGLMGEGSFVNTATIGTLNTAGAGFPVGFQAFVPAITYLGVPETTKLATLRIQTSPPGAPPQFVLYQFGIDAALNSFANSGTVNGDLRLTTGEVDNSGTINLASRATGTLIYTAEDRDFSFVNSGTISYIDNGARAGMAAQEAEYLGDEDAGYAVRLKTFEASEGRAVDISNTGTLQGGLSGFLVGDTIAFTNSGTMSGMLTENVLAHGVNFNLGRLRALDGEETDFGGTSVSIANAASGTIDDGFRMFAIADSVTFTNDGTITGRGDDNRAVSIEHEGMNEGDATSFAFINTGTLNGDVVLNTTTVSTSVDNSGDITMVARAFDPFGAASEALEIEVETVASHGVDFVNSGTITHQDRAATAVSFELSSAADSSVTIVNSGTIRSDGGGTVADGEPFGFEPGTQLVNISAGLAVSAGDVEGVADVTISNEAGGVISAAGVYSIASGDGASPSTDGSTAYSTALLITADTVTITNGGTITGGQGATLSENQVLTNDLELADNYLAGAIQTGASIDRVTNLETGVIAGSIHLGAGDDFFANYGTITGNIFLGDGNDHFIHLLNASFTGVADGGFGDDLLEIDLTGSNGVVSNALYGQFINFETIALISNGTGVVVEDGGELDIGEGSRIDTPGETAIQGGDEGEAVTNGGTITGDIDLGDGDNSFTNNGDVTGDVTTGNGDDIVSNAAGGTITGDIDLGGGDDSFSNDGTIIGNVALGDGADSYILGQGTVSGIVDGGSGDDIDSIVINFAAPAPSAMQMARALSAPFVTVTAESLGNVVDFEQLAVNGPGTVIVSGELPVGTVLLTDAGLSVEAGASFSTTGPVAVTGSAGQETVINAGTINGAISLGDGMDELASTGLITGAVDLGAGDDRLTLGSGARFLATVSGGGGSDTIVLATNGSDTTPFELDGSGFTAFERLTNSGGTAAVSGALALGQIDVSGGRLIGRAGSVLTGNVAVASGATFGSAGTVNGNVTVATGGTLSPGASPGVMTVNGNVSLATGTTTIFEFQPSPLQSDQLLISGTLNIASGATLNLTGNRPLTPGVAYDLIIATGGITGTFMTTNQAATVLGFLRYTADRLQLLGTFQAGAGVSPQVAASIDYVNAVLVAGGSTALLNAVPSLLATDGTASAAAFALIGPEAYASAAALGQERGLGLAKAARAGLGRTMQAEPGLFAFAQGMGSWRDLDADAGRGVSGSDIESYGVLGGIGYGNATGSIGAFVGTIDSEQRLEGISARTDADGVVAGVIGRFAGGGFDAAVLVAYDWGNADTVRAVPAGGSVSAGYKLRSFVLDAAAGYAMPLSADWALRPEIGITHIATDRDGATETGSTAFGLAVQDGDYQATFVEGSIGLMGGNRTGAAVRPWVKAGVRHLIDGDRPLATAGFAGGTLTYSLPGVARARTLAIAGVGASADLGSNVSLYGAYEGEFGKGSSHNLNLGLRIGF